MPPQQTPQEVELMIEQLAREKNLGKLEQLLLEPSYLIASFLLFLVLGGIVGIFFALGNPSLSLEDRIGVGCICAIFMGLGMLGNHLRWYTPDAKDSTNDRIGIYEHGLIYKKGNDLGGIRWDEIRSYHHSMTVDVATSTLGLKDGSTTHLYYATGPIEQAVKQHRPSLFEASPRKELRVFGRQLLHGFLRELRWALLFGLLFLFLSAFLPNLWAIVIAVVIASIVETILYVIKRVANDLRDRTKMLD